MSEKTQVKAITAISIDPLILKNAQDLAAFFGHRSLSALIEELLKAWLADPARVEALKIKAKSHKEASI